MSLDVSLGAAFLAGLLSFLPPCTLPLVPPFLCYMAGVSAGDLSNGGAAIDRGRILVSALIFVAGFSAVFVGLGATASVFGKFITGHLSVLGMFAGIVIVAMGLHFLGVLRISFLYRSATIDVARKPAGLLGAFVMGLAGSRPPLPASSWPRRHACAAISGPSRRPWGSSWWRPVSSSSPG